MTGKCENVPFDRRALAAVAMVAIMAVGALALFAPSSEAADGQYDGTIELYGFTVRMGLQDPSQVESVTWDFGDGSETVTVTITDDNPNGETTHTYAAIGEYDVTATMNNNYTQDGQTVEGETVLTYLYRIMGFPVVTFETGEGTPVEKIEGTRSAFVAQKPADPTREGYVFTGWYTDADCTMAYDWSATVVRHITLYAGWALDTVTVSFDLNGGEGAIEPVTVTNGKPVSEPAAPTRAEYVFMGWQFNGSAWDFTDPVTSDMTLVAMWEPETEYTYFTVTYDANGGVAGASHQNVMEGGEITLPVATRDGYTFDGWYDGEMMVGAAGDKYTVNADVTLKAHWTEVPAEVPGDGEGDGDNGILWLILAIVFAVLAVVCVFVAFTYCVYAVGGTVVFAVAALISALLHMGVI